jgi:DNA repair protein RecO (recombination protein O)
MIQSRATLLRKYPLGETSLILVWCTASHGLVRTAAKGARGPKSPFAGKLDLFFQAEIAWQPARRGDLHALREVVVESHRLGLRERYQRTLTAAYFTSLIELVAETETPIPELNALLIKALDWLADHEPIPAVVTRFEDRVAAIQGLVSEGNAGAAALLDTFHRLPPGRASLFSALQPS